MLTKKKLLNLRMTQIFIPTLDLHKALPLHVCWPNLLQEKSLDVKLWYSLLCFGKGYMPLWNTFKKQYVYKLKKWLFFGKINCISMAEV